MEYIKTGIPGVDEILDEKGIPKGDVIFLSGAPGSGKTIFSIQFLYNGAVDLGELGVYVTLDERPSSVFRNVECFGWDLEKLVEENSLGVVDYSPIRRLPREIKVKREFSLLRMIETIKKEVDRIGAKRIVIDPVTIMTLRYPSRMDRIEAVMDLHQALVDTGCTTILGAELKSSSLEREYELEEYLSQGVITLRSLPRPGGLIRVFQVEKMRGLGHDNQPHPYRIAEKGIVVYPRERVL